MPGSPETESEQHQQDPDTLASIGQWLFRYRTSLPLPIAAALLLVPTGSSSPALVALGATAVVAGELLRLWAVRHIGVISRTRSERLGPLVSSGPFGFVRNPLYLGNLAIWTGFTLSANLLWLAPIVFLLLVVEYHAIVRWEEQLLASRIGEPYKAYLAAVPRWIPRSPSAKVQTVAAGSNSWRQTLFSERGTLLAIALGYLLLLLKRSIPL
jgi:protein-S-isoprenylcysteine O-methyltransferase Ste14